MHTHKKSLSRSKFLSMRLLYHPVFNKLIILPVIFLNLVILDSCISPQSFIEQEQELVLEETEEEGTINLSIDPPDADEPELWQDEFLAPKHKNLKGIIDYNFSQALAKAANKRGRRWDSKGNCLRAVRFSLWEILRKLKRRGRKLIDLNKMPCDHMSPRRCALYNAGVSAENFRRWAKDNPVSLFSELGLADVTNIPNIKPQKGFIFAYAKGKYGFHRKHGHIEVITRTKPLVVCSDHCKVRKRYRKPSLILAPIKELPALLSLKGKLKFL